MFTRDGVELASTVYLPTGGGRHPVLLARTPYDRRQVPGPGIRLDVERLVEAGYAVVVQDVRGTGESGGEFRFFTGEAADGYDAVRWAATQPWSDGNVGMFGDSYLGYTQLLAAREQPEGLRAIAPSVTPAGLYETVYSDGVPNLNVILTVSAVVLGGLPPTELAAMMERLPPSDQPLLDDLVPFYRAWMETTDPAAELWREPVVDHSRIEVPALVSTGWHDYFRDGSIGHYERMRGDSRLIVGPWTHFTQDRAIFDRDYGDRASQAAIDWTGIHLDWFGHWLRGEPLRDDDRVRIFVMGVDEWRTERDWPLHDARRVPYHLGEDGSLGAAPATGSREFTSDPFDPMPTLGGAVMMFDAFGPLDQRPLDGRGDVLRYVGEPLERPLEVTGEVELVATVSSTGPSHLTAKLVDVYPDGRAELITDAVTSFDQDGEVRVRLGAISNVFRAGHRIRLDVAAANFPKYARHPAMEKVTVTVHAPSYLVLPVVDRASV